MTAIALIADDDAAWRRAAARSLTTHGFDVRLAATCREAEQQLDEVSYLVAELRFADGSGYDLLRAAARASAPVRTIVVTHHTSTPAVVRLMKLGAFDVLAKPATGEQLVAAFDGSAEDPVDPALERPSLARMRWEHLHRALAEAGGNVSAAARALGIHRQSLQRALRKHAP